jgi:membrane protein DedA with SNARE-associated domain
MSLSPDFCVRQTATMFVKVGCWSLLFTKLFSALSTISVVMVGVTRMPVLRFFSLDVIGNVIFVGDISR